MFSDIELSFVNPFKTMNFAEAGFTVNSASSTTRTHALGSSEFTHGFAVVKQANTDARVAYRDIWAKIYFTTTTGDSYGFGHRVFVKQVNSSASTLIPLLLLEPQAHIHTYDSQITPYMFGSWNITEADGGVSDEVPNVRITSARINGSNLEIVYFNKGASDTAVAVEIRVTLFKQVQV